MIAGKFRIEKPVGSGAMGAVYRARQIALDKVVAVKVLHRQYADDPTFMARFEREAKAATRVDHPNSMRVLDFGQEPDGLLYIAMEFLDGTDLFRIIQQQWPLPPARIVDVLGQALAAIAVAHDLGIVHRDLKPENIMIVRGIDDEGRPRDVVKVCDFGIAKFTENRGTLSLGAPKLTSQGIVVGTPEYMSPEQAKGERLDARSDLYSMGVILYHLLTGRVPFEAETALAVVFKHVTEEPAPPHTWVPDVDPALEAICLKAMRKRRDDRYPSARELRSELRAALTDAATFSRGPTQLPTAPQSGEAGLAAGTSETALALVSAATALLEPVQTPAPASAARSQSKPTLDAPVALSNSPSVPPKRRGVALAWIAAAAGATALTVVAAMRARTSAGPSPSQASAVMMTPPPELAPVRTQPPSPSSSSPADEVQVLEPAPPPGRVRSKSPPAKTLVARTSNAGPAHASAATANPEAFAPAAAQEVATPVSAPPPVTPAPAPEPSPPPLPTVATPVASPPAASEPFDPERAHVDYTVTSAGGGATVRAVQRALQRAQPRWTQCYRGALQRRGASVEDRGSMHVVTDEIGNVLTVTIDGIDTMPHVKQCIQDASRVRVDGVDTGDAWADVRIVLRAE